MRHPALWLLQKPGLVFQNMTTVYLSANILKNPKEESSREFNIAAYQYQPLKPKSLSDDQNATSIRLLTLLPGSREEQVCCQLRVAVLTELVDDEKYEALSYCWGTESASMSIQLSNYDDEGEAVRFDVRPNLHAALCAFRLEDETRTLWIDAICSNQDDNLEKNTQIPLMRRIYEGAHFTLIWLGER
jgi:hypothetical protein